MTVQVHNALATVAVRDIAAAGVWYARLFDREPDARPMDGLIEWQFPAGGWLQVYREGDHAGHCSVTLVVPDIEQCCRNLDQSGHRSVQRIDSAKAHLAMIRDPDGNLVAFVQGRDAAGNPSAKVQ